MEAVPFDNELAEMFLDIWFDKPLKTYPEQCKSSNKKSSETKQKFVFNSRSLFDDNRKQRNQLNLDLGMIKGNTVNSLSPKLAKHTAKFSGTNSNMMKSRDPLSTMTSSTTAKATLETSSKSPVGITQTNEDEDEHSKKSEYPGVSWYKRTNRWVVQIKANGRRRHIGYFLSEDKAAIAFRQATKAIAEHGDIEDVIKRNKTKKRKKDELKPSKTPQEKRRKIFSSSLESKFTKAQAQVVTTVGEVY